MIPNKIIIEKSVLKLINKNTLLKDCATKDTLVDSSLRAEYYGSRHPGLVCT